MSYSTALTAAILNSIRPASTTQAIQPTAPIQLAVGQTITATVQQVVDNAVLLNIAGRTIAAKTELPLQPNQQVTLNISQAGPDQITMRLLNPNGSAGGQLTATPPTPQATSYNLQTMLNSWGMEPDATNLTLANALFTYGQTVTPEDIQVTRQAWQALPNATPSDLQALAYLRANRLPLGTEAVALAKTWLDGLPPIAEQLTSLQQTMDNALAQLQQAGTKDATLNTLANVLQSTTAQIANWPITAETPAPEIAARLAGLVVNLGTPPEAELARQPAVTITAENFTSVSSQPVSDQQSAVSGQPVNSQPMGAQQSAVSGQPVAVSAQPMGAQQAAVSGQPVSAQPSAISYQPVSAQQAAVSGQQSAISGQLSAISAQPVSGQPAAVNAQPVSGQPPAISYQPAVSGQPVGDQQSVIGGQPAAVSDQPADGSRLPPPAMTASPAAETIRAAGPNRMTLPQPDNAPVRAEPMNLPPVAQATPHHAAEATNPLRQLASVVSDALEKAQLDPATTQSLRQLSDQLTTLSKDLGAIQLSNLAQTVNSSVEQAYLFPVPLQTSEGPRTAQLKVYRQPGKEKIDPDNVHLALLLDMPSLGEIAVDMTVFHKQITGRILSGREETETLVRADLSELTERLNTLGYSIHSLIADRIKPQSEQPATGESAGPAQPVSFTQIDFNA